MSYSTEETNLISALTAIPKADLHIHLEGSVSAETFLNLCDKNSIDPFSPVSFGSFPPIAVPPLVSGQWPELRGFRDFIGIYVKITEAIRSAEDLVYIGKQYLESCRRQNIDYSEIYFSPSNFAALGRSLPELYQGLVEIQRIARTDYNFETPFIFDIVRNAARDGLETIGFADAARKAGVHVAAVGIAGMEAGNPARKFAGAIDLARGRGYRILIHAGELVRDEDGIVSMTDALALRPDRIGHGLAAIADKKLTGDLLRTETVIELCPWSNLQLQIRTEQNHPAAAIIAAGVPVVICSDDPGIFGKTVIDNYLLCHRLGVSKDALLVLAANSRKIAEKAAKS